MYKLRMMSSLQNAVEKFSLLKSKFRSLTKRPTLIRIPNQIKKIQKITDKPQSPAQNIQEQTRRKTAADTKNVDSKSQIKVCKQSKDANLREKMHEAEKSKYLQSKQNTLKEIDKLLEQKRTVLKQIDYFLCATQEKQNKASLRRVSVPTKVDLKTQDPTIRAPNMAEIIKEKRRSQSKITQFKRCI